MQDGASGVEDKRILIVGGGAVGTLIAHALIEAGVRPYILLKDHRQFLTVRESGLRLRLADGSITEVKNAYFMTYEELKKLGSFDLIVLATKAYDFSEALKSVSRYLSRNGILLTCQNGLRSYEEAIEALGPERTATLVLNHGVHRIGSHEFVWIGGSASYLGSEGASEELLKEISSLLKVLSVSVVSNIEPYRWVKLSVNAAINPLTALHGVRNKYVVIDENLFRVATKVVNEVREVAEKSNIRLYTNPLEEMARVAKATGENYSSMCQDLMSGKRTEVDYINGEVVLRGRKVGVETPLNEALWLLIKFKESHRSELGRV